MRKAGAMTRAQAAAVARAARAAKAPPLQERFWSKVDRRGADECWPWTAAARRKDEGYGAFWLDRRHQPASKVAWILTNGPVPAGLVVCHQCDNPPCCNPAHMFLGTRLENDQDRVRKKRHCYGSRIGNAVLTEEIVLALRALAAQVGKKEAARRMGINYATACDACTRRWKHI